MDRHGSHSQRVPYGRKEGRKSLFSKVKDSVKDMLSPSWLSDLVSNVKKESSDGSETRQPEINTGPVWYDWGMRQPVVQQQHSSSVPIPSQSGLPLGNGQPPMMDFANRGQVVASNEGQSPFQRPVNIPPPVAEFTSSQLPLTRITEKSDSVMANEDSMSVSQRSDVSKSTSGCSSMVPQVDSRRRERGLLEKRKGSEPEIFSGSNSPSSPSDQPSKRQRLQVSINSSKTWTRGLGDSFSKPQAPANINRPAFNTSLFGSPLVQDDSSILGSSYHDSSFYPGKTTFGGKSSMSFRSRRNKMDLNQSLPARLSIPVKAFMKAKPKVNLTKEAVTSSTAKRILDALDKMPTPMNDAKKIPLSVPRNWTESPTFFSRDRAAPRMGPPTQKLNISSLASISQNRQVSTPPARRPTPSTSQNESMSRAGPSREDTIILGGGPGAPPPSGKMRREKSYHKGSMAVANRAGLEEEDTEILPSLTTDFTLPVSSMPKFNFATPAATQSSTSTPSKPALNFTFSSPIPENVPVNKPESPETRGGFHFSSPISVDKQPAGGRTMGAPVQKEPARATTVSSQSQIPAAPLSFGSPMNRSDNMSFSFSEAAAPKPKAKLNGPSSEMDSFQPASQLKQGSVMDILGGGSSTPSTFGGVGPASKLKQGSVMDILGGSTGQQSLSATGFTGFPSSTKNTGFGASTSEFGNQLPAASTASSLPRLSTMFSSAGWSCDVCLVKNNADANACVACQTPKPGPAKPISDSPAAVPLSQLFKKSGWTCDACLVKNNSDASTCVACQSAKPRGGELTTQKPPPLSALKTAGWTCDVCLVNNKQDAETCVACQSAKPSSIVLKGSTGGQNDLMAKFKPATGQWECEICLVRNKPDLTACVACQTPKPFKSFKHPPGDWTCDTCLVSNKGSSVKCVACSYARPGPPRTQTVPSCVKTFTQSSNSGFKPLDASKASNVVVESGGGFKVIGGDSKAPTAGGFTFGAPTSVKTTEASSASNSLGGGFKLDGNNAVSTSTSGSGFKFGDSSDTKSQPSTGGLKFGAGTPTIDKQTTEIKFGESAGVSKPVAAGGFSFGASAPAAQSNSISSENKSVVATSNSLQGGFSFGQAKENKPADPLQATTSVPGGFSFKPSDSVVGSVASSAKTNEPSSQLTSPSPALSVGGFGFSAGSKPKNSISTTNTTVQSSAVTQNSIGGFNFTATKVTQNSVTVPSQPSEGKPAFGGFNFGSTSTNTSQQSTTTTTPAFGGFNFAQKPSDSTAGNTASTTASLKRDRDDDSGATQAKKPSFAFGAAASTNSATPFQFGATNSVSTSSTAASTSGPSAFAFGKQNSAPAFGFSAGKTNQTPTPVFGAANASSQFGTGAPAFGSTPSTFTAQKTSAPTAAGGSSMFAFGGQSSQQPTTAAAPSFGGFGSTSTSFGAGSTPAFGGNAPSTTPAFGATPTAFGSSSTGTAAPAFGGKQLPHVSCLSSLLSSTLSSPVAASPSPLSSNGAATPGYQDTFPAISDKEIACYTSKTDRNSIENKAMQQENEIQRTHSTEITGYSSPTKSYVNMFKESDSNDSEDSFTCTCHKEVEDTAIGQTRLVADCEKSNSFVCEVSVSKSLLSNKLKDNALEQSEHVVDSLNKDICGKKEDNMSCLAQVLDIDDRDEVSESVLNKSTSDNSKKRENEIENVYLSKCSQTEEGMPVCRNDESDKEIKTNLTYKDAEVQTVCFQSTQTSDTVLNQAKTHDGLAVQWLPVGGGSCLAILRLPSTQDTASGHILDVSGGCVGWRRQMNCCTDKAIADVVTSNTLPVVLGHHDIALSTDSLSNGSCSIADQVSAACFPVFTSPINTVPVASVSGLGKPTIVSQTGSLSSAVSSPPVTNHSAGRPEVRGQSTVGQTMLTCGSLNYSTANSFKSVHGFENISPLLGSVSSTSTSTVSMTSANNISTFLCNQAVTSGDRKTPLMYPYTGYAAVSGINQSQPGLAVGYTSSMYVPPSVGTATVSSLSTPFVASSGHLRNPVFPTSQISTSSFCMGPLYNPPTSSAFSWKKTTNPSSSTTPFSFTMTRKPPELPNVVQPARPVHESGMEMDISEGSNSAASSRVENIDGQNDKQRPSIFVFNAKSSNNGNNFNNSQNQRGCQSFEHSSITLADTSRSCFAVKVSQTNGPYTFVNAKGSVNQQSTTLLENLSQKNPSVFVFGSTNKTSGSHDISTHANVKKETVLTKVASSSESVMKSSGFVFSPQVHFNPISSTFGLSSVCDGFRSAVSVVPLNSTASPVKASCHDAFPFKFSQPMFSSTFQPQVANNSNWPGQSSKIFSNPNIPLYSTGLDTDIEMRHSDEAIGSSFGKVGDMVNSNKFVFSPPITSSCVPKAFMAHGRSSLLMDTNEMVSAFSFTRVDSQSQDQEAAGSSIGSGSVLFGGVKDFSKMEYQTADQMDEKIAHVKNVTFVNTAPVNITRESGLKLASVLDSTNTASGSSFKPDNKISSDVFQFNAKKQGSSALWLNQTVASNQNEKLKLALIHDRGSTSCFAGLSTRLAMKNKSLLKLISEDNKNIDIASPSALVKKEHSTINTSASDIFVFTGRSEKAECKPNAPETLLQPGFRPGCSNDSVAFGFTGSSSKSSGFAGIGPRPSISDSSVSSESSASPSSSSSETSSLQSSDGKDRDLSSSDTDCNNYVEHFEEKEKNDNKNSVTARKYSRLGASPFEKMRQFAKKISRRGGNQSYNALPDSCLGNKIEVRRTSKPLSYLPRNEFTLISYCCLAIEAYKEASLGEDLMLSRPADCDCSKEETGADCAFCFVPTCEPSLCVVTSPAASYFFSGGFSFNKPETNNNSAAAAPAQGNAVFQFGAKPAEASQPTAGFNFGQSPAQTNFNFGAGSAPGALSFSAQPSNTPGQPERRIKKAVRKIRR